MLNRFVSKDRKVLRKIDKDAARQSIQGVIGSLVVFAVIALGVDLFTMQANVAAAMSIALAVSSFIRLYLIFRFEHIYPSGPRRWRRLFAGTLLLHACIWSVFLLILLWNYSLNSYFFIAALYTIGISTAFANNWMASIKVGRTYLAIAFIPASIALVFHGTTDAALMGVLFLLFFYHMNGLTLEQYNTFWRAVTRSSELRARVKDLEVVNAAKESEGNVNSHLISSVARELRTPLNSLMGTLSLLSDADLRGQQRDYVNIAARSGDLILSILDDVVDISSIIEGRLKVEQSVFNLRRTVEDCIGLLAPLAREKGVELVCVYDPQLPLRVRGDAMRISQVITNLVSNAIKYGKGTVRVNVAVHGAADGAGTLGVDVIDEGEGISEQKQRELFDVPLQEFMRQVGQRGGGLGIAVCRGLVEAMSGHVGVRSKSAGHGNYFWFSVPISITSNQTVNAKLRKNMGGMKAVLYNRSPDIGDAIRAELTNLGVELKMVDNFVAAIAEKQSDLWIFNLDHDTDIPTLLLATTPEQLSRTMPLLLIVDAQQRADSAIVRLESEFGRLAIVDRPVSQRRLVFAFASLLKFADDIAKEWGRKDDRSNAIAIGRRVLLVEDNPVNQMVTKGMLGRLGFSCRVAENGAEAIELWQKQYFDLIIMDVEMPVMDGIQATQWIRAQEEKDGGGHRTPIVAITANTKEGEVGRCLAAGMDDYLAKPVPIDVLDSKCRQWLAVESGEKGVITLGKSADTGDIH